MTELPIETPVPSFKNRRGGLIGCGIIQLLFGLGFLGFCALMLIGMLAASRANAPAALPPGTLASMSFMYVLMAAVFITLGIGSMMARRWAPPLTILISVAWLFIGVVGGAAMLFVLPRTLPAVPAQQHAMVVGCMAVMFGLFGIVVPAAFLLFYRSPHVKATVERLDPVPRWTDRVPLPLLGFALWMFIGAASLLFSGLTYRAFPMFGVLLRGWQLVAVQAVMAAILVWIGIGTLRRQRAAWWAALGFMIFGLVYAVVFMPRMDYAEWYNAMSMPVDRKQLEMMQSMYSSPFFYVWIAVMWGAYLAFLMYIRRYFFEPRSRQ